MAAEPNSRLSGDSPQILKTGVRRVNNKPILIVLGIFGLFLVLVGWAVLERNKQTAVPQDDQHGGTAIADAQTIPGMKDGYIAPKVKPPPLPTPEALPAQAGVAAPSATPDEEALRRLREKQALLDQAMKAKTSLDIHELGSASFTQQAPGIDPRLVKADPNNLNAEALARYKDLTQNGINGSGNAGQNPSSPNDLSSYNADKDRWKLDTTLEKAPSPYLLRTGYVIPAILISSMDSELPGTIIAQVSQNVYDTATGNYLLIPQGSRLVGAYSNQIAYGQSRIFVAWQRIIFPDASALDIGAMPGTDSEGEAGFNDKTNNHFIRIFGSALLMSAITAGVTYSQDSGNNNNNPYGNQVRTGDILSQSLGQELGSTMAELMQKNLNIAPTLKIRPGYRFNILVVKDLILPRPYQVANY
jgi:type IV secretory pathway VirB10-like protein